MKLLKKSLKKAKTKAVKKSSRKKKASLKSAGKERKSGSQKRLSKGDYLSLQISELQAQLQSERDDHDKTLAVLGQLDTALMNCCKQMDRAGTVHLLTDTIRYTAQARGWVSRPNQLPAIPDQAPG